MHSKDFLGKGATAQKPAPPKGDVDKRASCDAVGYTLLISLSFAPHLLSKFSPSTAGNIDCNFSLFNLPKDDKKAADIFSITDLKVSIKFLFLLHKTPPICIRRQKIRAISVAFIGSFFARILIRII